jgi:hypothetical protein
MPTTKVLAIFEEFVEGKIRPGIGKIRGKAVVSTPRQCGLDAIAR